MVGAGWGLIVSGVFQRADAKGGARDETDWVSMVRPPRFVARPLSGLRPGAYGCGLARERFTQHLRCKRPFHESWHKCVHEAIQSARNYSGPVFPQRVKALRIRTAPRSSA